MEIFIHDKMRERIGIVQNYTSIQWQRCYDEQGEFKIILNETEENIQLYKEEHVLHKTDDNTVGYIKYVDIDNGVMEVRGYLDNLDQRINYGTVRITKTETDLYKMINDNKRKLEITTAKAKTTQATISPIAISYSQLNETLTKICRLAGLGYRQIKKGDTFGYFELYKGTLNENGVFSEEFNNLFIRRYLRDISEYKNYAIVAGEGEGSKRKIVYVDRTGNGPRYELYVDARDLQSTYMDDAGTEHTYTDKEYTEVLKQRGDEKLNDHPKVNDFEMDYDVTNESFKYNRDWYLGDILKVKSGRYGFVKYMRADKIKEVYEGDYKVIATLAEVKI